MFCVLKGKINFSKVEIKVDSIESRNLIALTISSGASSTIESGNISGKVVNNGKMTLLDGTYSGVITNNGSARLKGGIYKEQIINKKKIVITGGTYLKPMQKMNGSKTIVSDGVTVQFDDERSNAGLSLNRSKVTIKVGETIQLSVEGSDHVKWSTGEKKIVMLSEDGQVTGLSPGTAVVVAETGRGRQKCIVIVE